jgi:hypothetical protein
MYCYHVSQDIVTLSTLTDLGDYPSLFAKQFKNYYICINIRHISRIQEGQTCVCISVVVGVSICVIWTIQIKQLQNVDPPLVYIGCEWEVHRWLYLHMNTDQCMVCQTRLCVMQCGQHTRVHDLDIYMPFNSRHGDTILVRRPSPESPLEMHFRCTPICTTNKCFHLVPMYIGLTFPLVVILTTWHVFQEDNILYMGVVHIFVYRLHIFDGVGEAQTCIIY